MLVIVINRSELKMKRIFAEFIPTDCHQRVTEGHIKRKFIAFVNMYSHTLPFAVLCAVFVACDAAAVCA